MIFLKINLKKINNADIQIFDIIGKSVLKLNTYVSNEQIDIADLKNGVYLSTITADNKRITKRIVKN